MGQSRSEQRKPLHRQQRHVQRGITLVEGYSAAADSAELSLHLHYGRFIYEVHSPANSSQ